MFNPYYLPYAQWNNKMLARRFPVRYLSSKIAVLNTISVATEGSVLIYQLCPWRFKQIPSEGLMLLHIAQDAPTGSTAFTVSLETQSNPQTGSTGTPLLNGVEEAITGAQIVNGSYLLVYYNKCQNIFQVVNDIPATA